MKRLLFVVIAFSIIFTGSIQLKNKNANHAHPSSQQVKNVLENA
jgi:hypothetical protein